MTLISIIRKDSGRRESRYGWKDEFGPTDGGRLSVCVYRLSISDFLFVATSWLTTKVDTSLAHDWSSL